MNTQNKLVDYSTEEQIIGTTTTENTIETQNIHAAGTLGIDIDLNELIDDISTAENYIEQHGFIRIDYKTTPGSIQLWNTGSYTITGITHPKAIQSIETRFLRELKELGIPREKHKHAKITNFVATCSLPPRGTEHLNLSAAAIGLGLEKIEYEPENFPGVLYRPTKTDGVCLIFGSGKILITGVKSKKSLLETTTHLETQLSALGLI